MQHALPFDASTAVPVDASVDHVVMRACTVSPRAIEEGAAVVSPRGTLDDKTTAPIAMKAIIVVPTSATPHAGATPRQAPTPHAHTVSHHALASQVSSEMSVDALHAARPTPRHTDGCSLHGPSLDEDGRPTSAAGGRGQRMPDAGVATGATVTSTSIDTPDPQPPCVVSAHARGATRVVDATKTPIVVASARGGGARTSTGLMSPISDSSQLGGRGAAIAQASLAGTPTAELADIVHLPGGSAGGRIAPPCTPMPPHGTADILAMGSCGGAMSMDHGPSHASAAAYNTAPEIRLVYDVRVPLRLHVQPPAPMTMTPGLPALATIEGGGGVTDAPPTPSATTTAATAATHVASRQFPVTIRGPAAVIARSTENSEGDDDTAAAPPERTETYTPHTSKKNDTVALSEDAKDSIIYPSPLRVPFLQEHTLNSAFLLQQGESGGLMPYCPLPRHARSIQKELEAGLMNEASIHASASVAPLDVPQPSAVALRATEAATPATANGLGSCDRWTLQPALGAPAGTGTAVPTEASGEFDAAAGHPLLSSYKQQLLYLSLQQHGPQVVLGTGSNHGGSTTDLASNGTMSPATSPKANKSVGGGKTPASTATVSPDVIEHHERVLAAAFGDAVAAQIDAAALDEFEVRVCERVASQQRNFALHALDEEDAADYLLRAAAREGSSGTAMSGPAGEADTANPTRAPTPDISHAAAASFEGASGPIGTHGDPIIGSQGLIEDLCAFGSFAASAMQSPNCRSTRLNMSGSVFPVPSATMLAAAVAASRRANTITRDQGGVGGASFAGPTGGINGGSFAFPTGVTGGSFAGVADPPALAAAAAAAAALRDGGMLPAEVSGTGDFDASVASPTMMRRGTARPQDHHIQFSSSATFGASLKDDTIADALRLQGGAPPQLTVHPFNASLVLEGAERVAARTTGNGGVVIGGGSDATVAAAAASSAGPSDPATAGGVLNATSAAWELRVREQISKLDAMFALNAVTEEEAETLLARVASGFYGGSTSSMDATVSGAMERQMSIMSVFPQMNPAAAANAAEAARRDIIPQSEVRQAQLEGGNGAQQHAPLQLHMSFTAGAAGTNAIATAPTVAADDLIPFVQSAPRAAQKVAFAAAQVPGAGPMQWSDGDDDESDDEASTTCGAELDAIVRLTSGPGLAVAIPVGLPAAQHPMLEAVADELDYAALRDRLQPKFDGACSESDTE